MLLDFIVPVHKQTSICVNFNGPNKDAGENLFGSSSSRRRSPRPGQKRARENRRFLEKSEESEELGQLPARGLAERG